MDMTFKFEEFGYEVQIGKFARQADGAVWIKQGGTVVLATVVSAPSKEFPGFLPLTTDYRELFSAAGKIPGGYYKREGRSTEGEILTSRLIDRAIRPLFPANYFDQVQVLSTVYSVDNEHVPSTLAFIATSLAISISKIPFLGPVGVIEMGRVDGKWVINPLHSVRANSDARLVIAGTQEGICMVEGSVNELSETEMVDVLFAAHDEIKKQVAWQEKIVKEIGKPKEQPKDHYDWVFWTSRVNDYLTEQIIEKAYIPDKVQRNEYLDSIREAFAKQYEQEITQQEVPGSVISYLFDSVFTEKVTEYIFKINKRIDGRAFDQIRPIEVEVGLLPFAHGSSFFQRGRTQALVSVTLGGGQDEQKTETLMTEPSAENGSFMLHYNFPPFSVGEVRPMRGPGRREIGHGNLAASAFRFVRPSKDEFPYTIRLVADMLESDGSTSMATACGSTMALMQAGVPIKKMVGGVAMGLLKNKASDFRVLSDISGFEDAFGLMDFKVVGTQDGITAIQMDIKYKGGLSRQIFEAALNQARQGRLHILSIMKSVMSAPNPTLSPLVPRVTTVKIDTDKIGGIIGKGGETIRKIIDVTKTSIDVEPDGLVKVFGGVGSNSEYAVQWIKVLAGQINPGDIFQGKVKRFADFGMFIEIVPNVQGLAHVSNIPRALQKSFMNEFKIDDEVRVQVLDYDNVNGRISLKILDK